MRNTHLFKLGITAFALLLSGHATAQTKTMKRLPDTGQTQSFTNTFGEDSDYTIYPPFFIINGDGTVTDTVTGLMWQQTDGGEMTIEAAETYCADLVLGGYDDWRLPTAQEAFSILNHGTGNPALDAAVFANTGAEYWWSSERQAGNAGKVWVTNAGGGIGNHLKTETVSAGGIKKIHVRAVRNTLPPMPIPQQYTVTGGTVTDEITRLEWQATASPDTITWEDALVLAENYILDGKDDWRLPNVKELESLNDELRSQPSINTDYIQGIVAGRYWTSTTLNNQPTRAWTMDTRFGVVSYDAKTNRNRALLVRSNEVAPPPPPPVAGVIHGEILGRPTDHSITVQMFFSENIEMCIQYGTSPGGLNLQTPWQFFLKDDPAEIIVDNLEADRRYFYRVCYRTPGAPDYETRPIHTFQTQRPPGRPFTFVVQADPHLDSQSDTALYRVCLQNQLADEPDFIVDLGDIIMSDKMKNAAGLITRDTVRYRAKYMRSYYETNCHSAPLFITLGNHEGEAGWQLNPSGENVAVYNTLERKKYYLNPAPDDFYSGDQTDHPIVGLRENYYAWEWGDALFVVLDPYWYTKPKPDSLTGWRWTLGKGQYDWLKSTLEQSTATFKFVFMHQLVGGDKDGRGGTEYADKYEWGGQNLDGTDGWAANRPGWDKPVKDLLRENRVNIFFHGHDHFFGKQEKDCLIYQETPQPSHPNYLNANQAAAYGYFAGQILPNAGHLRVSVSPDGVKTEYVRAYLPQNETAVRKNRGVSATYYIGKTNCYDSLSTGTPVLWNTGYTDELIFPNPSAGEVVIRFSLTDNSHTELSIFDSNGKMVRRLLAGDLISSGEYEIIWDGRDGTGRELEGGIYFWKLESKEGGSLSGKIIRE